MPDPGIVFYLKKFHLVCTLFLWWKDQYYFLRGNGISLSRRAHLQAQVHLTPESALWKSETFILNNSLFVINIHLTNIWGWVEIETLRSVCNLPPTLKFISTHVSRYCFRSWDISFVVLNLSNSYKIKMNRAVSSYSDQVMKIWLKGLEMG